MSKAFSTAIEVMPHILNAARNLDQANGEVTALAIRSRDGDDPGKDATNTAIAEQVTGFVETLVALSAVVEGSDHVATVWVRTCGDVKDAEDPDTGEVLTGVCSTYLAFREALHRYEAWATATTETTEATS